MKSSYWDYSGYRSMSLPGEWSGGSSDCNCDKYKSKPESRFGSKYDYVLAKKEPWYNSYNEILKDADCFERDKIQCILDGTYKLKGSCGATYLMCYAAVMRNGMDLEFARYKTKNICLKAVEQNGFAIKFIANNLPKVSSYKYECIEEDLSKIETYALRQNGMVLQILKTRNKYDCLSAVKQNGLALQFIENQTDEICFEAVRQNGLALQFVKKQTVDICYEAVKQNGLSLQFIENQTENLCIKAVKKNWDAIKHVKKQTEKICKEAVESSMYAFEFVEFQDEEMCEAAIETHVSWIKCVKNKTDQLIKRVLYLDPSYYWIMDIDRDKYANYYEERSRKNRAKFKHFNDSKIQCRVGYNNGERILGSFFDFIK